MAKWLAESCPKCGNAFAPDCTSDVECPTCGASWQRLIVRSEIEYLRMLREEVVSYLDTQYGALFLDVDETIIDRVRRIRTLAQQSRGIHDSDV